MSSEPETNKYKGHSSGTVRKTKHRSRSTPRHNNVDKPKKRHISAATSFASIPSTIRLTMLNSGLLPTSRFNEENGSSVVATITDSPIDLKSFMKICEQRKKFPVLYKLEFELNPLAVNGIQQSRCFFYDGHLLFWSGDRKRLLQSWKLMSCCMCAGYCGGENYDVK